MTDQTWDQRLDALEGLRHDAAASGGAERVAARRSSQAGTARDWIEGLLDRASFSEIGLLVGDLPADGFIAGYGTVDGRPVLVGAEDFTIKGGSLGAGGSAKRHRLVELAGQERVPLVLFLEGAGARVEAGAAPLPRVPYDIQELVALSGMVPIVTAVMGVSAGHSALAAPLSDFVIMSERASLFAAGPPLVKQALGEVVDKQALGGPDVHTKVSGVAHNAVGTSKDAVDLVRRYLAYFPSNAWTASPTRPGSDIGPRQLDQLLDIIPVNSRSPYDVRDVIEVLVDDGEHLEVAPEFGSSLVTSLAHVGGQTVAIIANQPKSHGGSLTSDAADKGARFIAVADAFHLPLVFLTDNPGVFPGSASEAAGILRSGARMYAAQVRARGPKFQFTLGKAFGFGAAIMAKVPFDHQTMNVAIPGGQAGALPARGGGGAAGLDAEAQEAMEAEQASASLRGAQRFSVDDLVDPREIRNLLLRGLTLSGVRRAGPHEPVTRPATGP